VSPIAIALVVFACVFGGAPLGMFLRLLIPEHHLSEGAREVIKLGIGLIATLSALVLGFVIATAKSSYDTHDAAIKHSAAKILLLDRVLSIYGPETTEVRDLLRQTVAGRIDALWPEDRSHHAIVGDAPEVALAARGIQTRILQLTPQNETQRWLRSKALQIGSDIMETRWLIVEGLGSSIPVLFLVVLVLWLTIIFASFGLLAPRNATVVAVLFLCALSVAGSIFLILEMDQPFDGLMKVSGASLRYAVSHLDQ
jgi:hypothetical protein